MNGIRIFKCVCNLIYNSTIVLILLKIYCCIKAKVFMYLDIDIS